MGRYVRRVHLPVSAEEAWRWHAREGAFERLTPPWERSRVIEQRGGIEPGAEKLIATHVGPLQVRWLARHGEVIEGREFRDVQVSGPFAAWEHVHRFEPADGGCLLTDQIDYRLPGGPLGEAVAEGAVRRRLERLFAYRHETTRADLALHQRYEARPLKVLLTGGTGLIGRVLEPLLTSGGHEVTLLRRGASWDPERGVADPGALAGYDAVVHLAGESIAGRWTAAKRERIRTSRERGTRALAEALASLPEPPRVLVSCSAVGYYGDRGELELTEESDPGTGFLAEVCAAWEAAARPAAEVGIRVVHPRLGVVLTPAGGSLPLMLLPFRLGLGGRLGSGRQWLSWITADDVAAGLLHLIFTDNLSGPVNLTAPQPVTNAEFTRLVSRLLRRPALLPAPAAALRLAAGEMAGGLLLASQRALPRRLLDSGFEFRHPALAAALVHLLGLRQP